MRYRSLIRFEAVGDLGDDTVLAVIPSWDEEYTFAMAVPADVATKLRDPSRKFPVRANVMVDMSAVEPENLKPTGWEL